MASPTADSPTLRRLALLLIPALSLGLAACAKPSATNTLPVLHLVSVTANAAVDLPLRADTSGASGITLRGELPTGPTHAAVYDYAATVDQAQVRQVAAAVGVGGADPVRHAYGWVVTGKGELRVGDDGTWSYARSQPTCAWAIDVDTAPSDSGVACSPPPVRPSVQGPDRNQALAIAQSVATALGRLDAKAATAVSSPTTTVSYPLQVSGLTVLGADLVVTVDAAGVSEASGSLAQPAVRDDYPIISATTAYEQLASRPVPALAISCPDPATTPGSTCGLAQVITGATLGLSVQRDGDRNVLVPTWLFTVAGTEYPLSVIAISPNYLANPEPTGQPSGGSGSGGASTSPGSGPVDQPGSTGGGSAGSGSIEPAPAPDQPVPVPTKKP